MRKVRGGKEVVFHAAGRSHVPDHLAAAPYRVIQGAVTWNEFSGSPARATGAGVDPVIGSNLDVAGVASSCTRHGPLRQWRPRCASS